MALSDLLAHGLSEGGGEKGYTSAGADVKLIQIWVYLKKQKKHIATLNQANIFAGHVAPMGWVLGFLGS